VLSRAHPSSIRRQARPQSRQVQSSSRGGRVIWAGASSHPTLLRRHAPFNHLSCLLSSSTPSVAYLNMAPSAVYPETEVLPLANSLLFLKENAKVLSHENAPTAGTVQATPSEAKPSSSDEIHEEYQYLNLIRRILAEGEHRPDRTGTGIFAPPHCAFPSRKPIQILLPISTLVYPFCRFSRQSVCSYAL
jgi:hypothetical protein